ncbi:MAG TPA: hypothetical protein VI997_01445 [Candidatus Thermoplasmatota archaeon]|nr:hypothetical protein [Candidatus Thermoplasmatota archaeon]
MRLPGGRGLAAAIALAILLAGCLTPAATLDATAAPPVPDPVAPGDLAVDVLDYAFGLELFDDGRGHTFPMHLRGSLHVPEGEGPFPVLVFVHGYHGTCSYPLLPQLPWYWGNSTPGPYGACPRASPVVEPADSFRGYDYFSDPLASHGYVIASIDAGELNDNFFGYDWKLRGDLVLRTLDHLREANEGVGPHADALEGELDLARIGIMGHSRGGQGVATAAVRNAERPVDERHAIVAVLGLAPVDATSESSVVADAAYATILPYCDGDVWNLAGARTFDRARYLDEARPSPKYQWLVMGTNHNQYNTAWARNANDASWMTDPYCGRPAPEGGFLGLDDTLRIGGALMGAFFRTHVGGEEGFDAFLRGDAAPPVEACPAAPVDCASLVHVSYHPPGPDRLAIEDAATDASLSHNDVGRPSRFDGFADASWCEPRDCPAQYNTAGAAQLHLAWDGPATWSTELGGADLSTYRWLSVRVGVNHRDARNAVDAPQEMRIVLTDASGNAATALASEHGGALFYPPGDGPGADVSNPTVGILSDNVFGRTDQNARVTLNELRVPLGAFAGVDLAHLQEVDFVFGDTPSGSIQVADVLAGR